MYSLHNNSSIYHYTNFEAVEGILTNKEIWMTPHQHLNDSQEYIEGFDRIKGIVSSYISLHQSQFNQRQVQSIQETIDWLSHTTLLVTSFSKAKDKESQWSYGEYSIEFNQNLIKMQKNDGVVNALKPCLYDVAEKNRQAKIIGETYLQAFSENVRKMDMYHLFIGYMEYLTRAKNEHFIKEEEVRLSLYMHDDNTNIYALKDKEIGSYGGTGKVLVSGPIKVFSELALKTNQQSGKSYYPFPININSIKSITVGTNTTDYNDNKNKIVKLLQKLNLEHIEVYKSEVSFRI